MSGIIKGIKKRFKKAVKVLKKIWKPLLIAVAIYFTAGLILSAMPATAGFAAAMPGFGATGMFSQAAVAIGFKGAAGSGIAALSASNAAAAAAAAGVSAGASGAAAGAAGSAAAGGVGAGTGAVGGAVGTGAGAGAGAVATGATATASGGSMALAKTAMSAFEKVMLLKTGVDMIAGAKKQPDPNATTGDGDVPQANQFYGRSPDGSGGGTAIHYDPATGQLQPGGAPTQPSVTPGTGSAVATAGKSTTASPVMGTTGKRAQAAGIDDERRQADNTDFLSQQGAQDLMKQGSA